ncbi:MAG: hypothetical protein ISS79_01305 [Phycisphaerae bacterium]|nr:hypothetical protein [Phycisphaerae bacterium]
MLYDNFKTEADFRAKFVRPLLTRLGFLSVAELHGQQEYGKDFVFSELTPFGFLRNYAAVVKHEKSIRQTSRLVCNDILAQVKQAFAVRFRLPDGGAYQRIGSVVIFNSGKISENARHWIRSELDEERYGRNVHILDGERLFQLDMTSTFRRGEQLLPRLWGMQNDIKLNLLVWHSISETLPKFAEGRGCFTRALEDFLAAPFLVSKIDLSDIIVLVQECRIIERLNARYMATGAPKGELREREITTLRSVISKATKRSAKILACINDTLATFRLLTRSDG